jgi:hypothetical protein
MKKLLFLAFATLSAQSVVLENSVISSGYVNSNRLTSTTGQPVVGLYEGDAHILSSGFWGAITQSLLKTVTAIFPTEFSISDAYPNPFNPVTAINISIPKGSEITIVVHDLLGRRLLKIEKNFTRAGNYQFVWSGKNASGENVTSGVYLISVQYDNKNFIKKVTLLK